MKVIDEFVEDIRIRLYQEKASACSVSSEMLRGVHPKYVIQIPRLLDQSHNFSEFDQCARLEFCKRGRTDFYDFSLWMGMNFGVYNSYNYLYLTEPVKMKLMDAEPSYDKTFSFFQNYYVPIYHYLEKQYGIDDSMYQNIVTSMFSVAEDNSLYNEVIVRDIGALLMGCQLRFGSTFSSKNPMIVVPYIRSGLAKEYFEQQNQFYDKKNRII